MTAEELHRLLENYRDGSLGAADARRLAEAIRADPSVAARARKELEFSGHLGQAVDDTADLAFSRSFAERVRAERGRDEFVSAFSRRAALRVPSRTRRRTAPSSSLPFLAAAALLIGLGLWLITLAGRPPAPAVVRKPGPPAPAPEAVSLPDPSPAPNAPVPEREPAPAPRTAELPAPVVRPPSPPEPAAPAPDPPRPADAAPPAPAAPAEVSRPAAVARIDQVEGEAVVGQGAARASIRSGQDLAAGQSVTTGPGGSRASILLPDGTRFRLGPDAELREIERGPKGTKVVLSLGTLMADVSRQPPDQPLVFVTPHGEARVLGTVFRLVVDGGSTRLEVKEGKIRLTREGKSIDVAAGQYAVAGAGPGLQARPLSPDEIVLFPQQARLTGSEWALQRDLRSLTGLVLEAGQTSFRPIDHVETRPAYATYTFFAPADKEYRIWLRATSFEKGDPWTRDAVTLEPRRAWLNQKSPFFGASPTLAWVITGVSATPGYSWISSHGEDGKPEVPLVVRFSETGFQTLRLYVDHPWIRIDTIWLSATQKSRPPSKQLPPIAPVSEK